MRAQDSKEFPYTVTHILPWERWHPPLPADNLSVLVRGFVIPTGFLPGRREVGLSALVLTPHESLNG